MAFLLKISVLVIAITMAAATITMKAIPEAGPKPELNHHPDDTSTTAPVSVPPSKRVSRFLKAATTSHPSANPRAADHCKNDNDICSIVLGVGGKCCNNKCMDLSSDKNNCGTCKNKCKFTHTCCNGQCVMTMFDKRHCGRCNNWCLEGQYCVYGMCNYG